MLAGTFDQLGELRSYDSLLVIFVLEAFLALVRERTGKCHLAPCQLYHGNQDDEVIHGHCPPELSQLPCGPL